jgi:hypothetical protein
MPDVGRAPAEEETMNVYEKRNAMLGVEFDRYVREHLVFSRRHLARWRNAGLTFRASMRRFMAAAH